MTAEPYYLPVRTTRITVGGFVAAGAAAALRLAELGHGWGALCVTGAAPVAGLGAVLAFEAAQHHIARSSLR